MSTRHATRQTADELVALLGPGPCRTQRACEAGISPGRLRAAVRAGTLLAPHRGVLLPASTLAAAPTDRARHLIAVRAALLVAPAGSVTSHDSAGVVNELARPAAGYPDVVHLDVPGEPARLRDGIRIHESALHPDDVTVVDGIATTTVVRTAIELARGRPLPSALIPLDSAMRRLVASAAPGIPVRTAVGRPALVASVRDQLRLGLQHVYGWPGTVVVREAVELADPAAESAFESRSRGWFIEAHLPAPQLGVQVQGADGRWYWVDFLWETYGVVGEADGWGKYGTTLPDMTARFRAEKERQEAIEATGRRFVRWTTDEARDRVIARVRGALAARVPARIVANSSR